MADYISEMRKIVGHRTIMCIACGVIIENDKGEILLQRRADNDCWGLPGGSMNIGESFVETAVREVWEETGLIVSDLTLFGIYSGEHCIVEYPNKDVCACAIVVFRAGGFKGELKQVSSEAREHRFFGRNSLPERLNSVDVKWIEQWRHGVQAVIVD